MRRNHALVALIMVFWFVISFITNIIGPLIPDIIDNFRLQHLALAGFIPMSFFLAYGIMSIPAGLLIERFSQKAVLTAGFALPLAGSLLFALFPTFPVLLASSFTIGLVGRLTSGERLTGFTGWLQSLTPESLPWVSLYWLFAVILVAVIAVVLAVRFPRLELQESERSGGLHSYKVLLKNRYVYLFFLGMLCYTASEQGVANWISEFLRRYHGLDPQTVGAPVVGRFWGYMSVGCLIGLFALKLWDARDVLKVSGALALVSLLAALFGSAEVAVAAFPAVGFSISVMFSIVMSLGLNSVDRYHGSFAGILCTGIAGGALGPLIVGWLGDLVGLRTALLFVCLTIGYIVSIAFWARPLIENKRYKLSELFKKNRQ